MNTPLGLEDSKIKPEIKIEVCEPNISLTISRHPFLVIITTEKNLSFTFLTTDLLKGILFDGYYIIKIQNRNIITVKKENFYLALTLPEIQTKTNG